MKITIAGEAGSGKGELKNNLSKILNYETWSIGDIRGEIAKKHGLTIDELNKIGETEDWTDREGDNFQKYELSKKQHAIIEGRLSWYFISESYKVFLDIEPREGARRIFYDQREDEKQMNSIAEMMGYIENRRMSDIKRYGKYYGVNPYKKEHYDLVIDTTNKIPEQTLREFLKERFFL